MKKLVCIVMAALMIIGLSACGTQNSQKQEAAAEGFQPALDTAASCKIVVAGSYNNFEALEAAFDHFNEYYPDVELTYTKLDDYKNIIGTALEGNDAPNIYVAHSWMVGNEQYATVLSHAENLADPALGLDLDCIRPNIILNMENGELPMVPIFATTHGMLVNNSLFESEELSVPTTYSELVSTCKTLREKGYANPMLGYFNQSSSSLLYSIGFPCFCAEISDDAEAVKNLNALDLSAREYMRSSLETAKRFIDDGCIDLQACAEIEDNYEAVIYRFFEGDVPMMICTGDTVSGTLKRESQSEAFIAEPFSYSFVPIPVSDDGAYFLDTPSLQFAVNKDCSDLEMTNEFMRFLITSQELSEMAQIKRLVSPTKDLSFDNVYAPFGQIPSSRIISPEAIGLMDDPIVQFRLALYSVGTGEMSVDDAVAQFGQFE